jgi:hypothetical protein
LAYFEDGAQTGVDVADEVIAAFDGDEQPATATAAAVTPAAVPTLRVPSIARPLLISKFSEKWHRMEKGDHRRLFQQFPSC